MSQHTEQLFPACYPVHVLRGQRRLTPTGVRRALRARVAFLTEKVALRAIAKQNTSMLESDLAAFSQALEVLEAEKGACGHNFAHVGPVLGCLAARCLDLFVCRLCDHPELRKTEQPPR